MKYEVESFDICALHFSTMRSIKTWSFKLVGWVVLDICFGQKYLDGRTLCQIGLMGHLFCYIFLFTGRLFYCYGMKFIVLFSSVLFTVRWPLNLKYCPATKCSPFREHKYGRWTGTGVQIRFLIPLPHMAVWVYFKMNFHQNMKLHHSFIYLYQTRILIHNTS